MKEVPFADTVGERGNITALTKVQNEHFPRIKLWIEEYFKKVTIKLPLVECNNDFS